MKSLTHAVRTTSLLTAAFVFALAASAGAAPQRDGGSGRSGGGHRGGGAPQGHVGGGPRGEAGGPRGHFHRPPARIIVGGGFYDPFWSPYYPYGYGYPYPYWPYVDSSTEGSLKTEITPKDAAVYVDGYYAGVADDFDGAFRRLHATPGGHTITFHLEGYQTVTRNVYVRPDSTLKLKATMEKLAPGDVSEPVQAPSTGRSGTPPADGGSEQ